MTTCSRPENLGDICRALSTQYAPVKTSIVIAKEAGYTFVLPKHLQPNQHYWSRNFLLLTHPPSRNQSEYKFSMNMTAFRAPFDQDEFSTWFEQPAYLAHSVVHTVSSMKDISSHYNIVVLFFIKSLHLQIFLYIQCLVSDKAAPIPKFSLSFFKKAS